MHPFFYSGIREGSGQRDLEKGYHAEHFSLSRRYSSFSHGNCSFLAECTVSWLSPILLLPSILLPTLPISTAPVTSPLPHALGWEPLFLFFCYLFFIGGVQTTSFMWLYTFPLFSLYLLGLPRGMWTTLLLFSFCTGFLVC